jgi:hypothetical protein
MIRVIPQKTGSATQTHRSADRHIRIINTRTTTPKTTNAPNPMRVQDVADVLRHHIVELEGIEPFARLARGA